VGKDKMRVAVLSANLSEFDVPIEHVKQNIPDDVEEIAYHRFTDKNFPPIIGLTPRLQYRIPKLYGWDMFPGYDVYIWYDASMSLRHPDSVKWLLEKLGDKDMAFFKHPWRHSIEEEVNHIEAYLQKGNEYIMSRYKNGLHKEQLEMIKEDEDYIDDHLFASTVFVYRQNEVAVETLKQWWYYQSRYFTCDQVALPYVAYAVGAEVSTIEDNLFKSPYVSLVSKHK
jgi:hypothetical protein